MFSRRHPFLFFMLMMATIAASGCCILAALTVVGIGIGQQADYFDRHQDAVGIISIVGQIADCEHVLKQLGEFRKDDAIKAIVLRIDSPGGGVAPSQEIYHEVIRTAAQKPVITSMGTVAASGGYYIAAGATGIMASPGTITGSIGVIMAYTNIEQLMQKIGLSPVVITSGQYKDLGSPLRPMTAEERQILQQLSNNLHRQFIADVAKGRKMPVESVDAIATGRVFTGQEAMALGLVDRMGNFEDAIEWAGRQGGIEGDIATVHARDRKLSWLKYVFDTMIQSIMEKAM
jgi:protease-4